MSRRSSVIPIVLMGSLFALILFCFTDIHWGDKTSTVISLSESLASGNWIGRQIPCLTSAGSVSAKPLWAEEPPVFHALAALLKTAGFTNVYGKLLAVLCCVSWALGLFACLKEISRGSPEESFLSGEPLWLALAAFFFTPMIAMHGAQPLPDDLMAAFLAWSLFFLLRRRLLPAFALAIMAVTTKALAIFGIMPVMLGYLLWDCREPDPWRRLARAAAGGLTILPMIAWLAYLATHHVDNPFFSERISISRHTGGGDFSVVLTFRYWWRYFTWMFYQGVSLPVAILAWIALGKIARNWSRATANERILFLFACFSPVYWAVVRGPQYSAPWYSFPFLFPFTLLGVRGILRMRSAWTKRIVVALVLAYSLISIEPTWDLKRTLFFDVRLRPVALACGRQGLD